MRVFQRNLCGERLTGSDGCGHSDAARRVRHIERSSFSNGKCRWLSHGGGDAVCGRLDVANGVAVARRLALGVAVRVAEQRGERVGRAVDERRAERCAKRERATLGRSDGVGGPDASAKRVAKRECEQRAVVDGRFFG